MLLNIPIIHGYNVILISLQAPTQTTQIHALAE
jgi:hypothetical protein